MRRVKPDPIPNAVQAKILDAAVRAPTGGNMQGWRFMLVDDQGVKDRLAPLYQDCMQRLWTEIYGGRIAAANADPEAESSKELFKMVRSAQHLADHFAEYPLFLFGFIQYDPSGGSIFPAVWSAQLAARAEGVGSALTSVMGMYKAAETLDVLGVPTDQGWINACCVSFGYPTGSWGVAPRRPAHEVSYRNQWGSPAGFEIPTPLWP
jgi:nitroreductase